MKEIVQLLEDKVLELQALRFKLKEASGLQNLDDAIEHLKLNVKELYCIKAIQCLKKNFPNEFK